MLNTTHDQRDLALFQEDVASLARMLFACDPTKRHEAFRTGVREGVRWIGRIAKIDVVDGLHEIGVAAGFNETEISDALAHAIEKPLATEPTKVPLLGKKYDWRASIETAASLQQRTFPPVNYVVPGLIPEGLSLLAGKPKIGKSWLALDLCVAIAAGRLCLGDKKPIRGDVLYAALEDNPRRLQRRLDKVLGTFTGDWPARLSLTTGWRRLDKGGVDDLAAWVEGAAEPRLIILDTLAGVRPVKTQQGYTEDYDALTSLHRLANDKAISILVLHHTRKMEAEDPVDTVSGTLGLAGCADTILVLNRTSKGTSLYVRGRDVEEAEHAMDFQKEACRWTIAGDAAEVQRSDERSKILDALKEAIEPLGPSDVAAVTGMKNDNVRFLLHKMVKAGEIQTEGRGKYVAC